MKNTPQSQAAEPHPHLSPPSEGAEREKRSRDSEVSLAGILIFVGIVVCMVGCVLLGLKIMYRELEKKAEQSDRAQTAAGVLPSIVVSRNYFPQPREQVSPHADLEAFRAREQADLESYGWIDRKSGVVRIPIERAMELISQRDLAARSNAGAAGVGPSNLELQQQRPAQTNGYPGAYLDTATTNGIADGAPIFGPARLSLLHQNAVPEAGAPVAVSRSTPYTAEGEK